MTIVVCVETQNYMNCGREYVENLRAMVGRNSTMVYSFLVITDRPSLEGAIKTGHGGWWGKMDLFNPETFEPDDRIVYFDLDTLILDNIDDIFIYDGPPAFLGNWRDGTWPLSTAFMAWRARDLYPIWEDWTRLGRPITKWGDDEFVRQSVPRLGIKYASAQREFEGFRSYKFHKLRDDPKDARVVCFCDMPKPHLLKNSWVGDVWHNRPSGAKVAQPSGLGPPPLADTRIGAGVPVIPAPPHSEGV